MWLLLIESILGILGLLALMLVLRLITKKIKGDNFIEYIPDSEKIYLNSLNSNNNDDDDWWWNPMYSYLPNNVWNGVDDDK